MARVGWTLASVVASAILTCPADGVRAQSAEPKPQAATDKGPPKKPAAAKKKSGDPAEKAEAGQKRDPATIEKSLDAARKSLDAGKPEQTVSQVNALIAAGGLDARSMARALALRGTAHKKQGKPAQAISDLQSALWLKGGLGDDERAAAMQARSEAYREAGLGEAPAFGPKGTTVATSTLTSGQPKPAPPSSASGSTASSSTAAVTPRTETPAPASSGVGGFFSNLFGGGAAKQPAPEASPVKAPAAATVSSWTNVEKPAAKAATVVAAAPKSAAGSAPPAATPATAGKQFRMQLGAVRDKAAAEAMGARVRKEHATQLAGRTLEVEETSFGNMGRFYRVRIGPYAESKDATELCGALRGKGIDCMVVAN